MNILSTRLAQLALLAVCATPLASQQPSVNASSRQPDVHLEKTLTPGSTVNIHNLSGDVRVVAGSGSVVEINGYKHGNRRYFDDVTLEVVESPDGITICSMFKDADMECTDRGLRVHDGDRNDHDLDIDIEVKLPKSMRIRAHSVSGDVTVTGAEGEVQAGSVSGDVEMQHLRATSVAASTVSGDVEVGIDALTGDGDLRFNSVSGDVTVTLPAGTDADVTMRSVSGELDTDFPLTLNGRMDRHALEARIGKGGRQLAVSTVSGDVRLRSPR
jgi:lia operon protein LiaG